MADEKYDQTFFLDLAAKGKYTWNAWRRNPANKDVRVTFAGVDFSAAPRDGIDFSGFEFGDSANFSQCKWRGVEWVERPEAFKPGRACFIGATFGHGASFAGAACGAFAGFTGVTFGHGAFFDGAVFGGGARFDGAAFGDKATFDGAAFGDKATFAGAAFDSFARFTSAAFGAHATFDGAAFGVMACFDGTAFGNEPTFAGAAFGNKAIFSHAAFGDKATFAGATFGSGTTFAFAAFGLQASFAGAAFGDVTDFSRTHFKGGGLFTGKSEEQWAKDVASALGMDKEARVALEKRHKDSWETTGSRFDRFLTISFSRARFDGIAIFSGRSFEQTADFTNARFYYPPDFDATANPSRIDFTGARIGFVPLGRRAWTKDSRIPIRLRALRKIAEQAKNHDLARDLYIEERKAERGVSWHQLVEELKKAPEKLKKKLEDIDEQQREVWSNSRHKARARNAHRLGIAVKIARLAVHGLWIVVMGVYWALADYGRSFARPAAWLGLSGYSFYRLYLWILAALMAKPSQSDLDRY
ncbi:MAG: pentapeptide repeat-containing protein [Methylocella sp.]